MARRSRQTFEEILVAVAPINASALEVKARLAGELAKVYPHRARPFAALEDRLLQQLGKVISGLTVGIHDRAPEQTSGLRPRLGLLPGQDPVDAFAGVNLELKQDLGRGEGAPQLVTGELRLADVELAPELRLGELEPPDLADAPANRFEVRRPHFILAVHMRVKDIICSLRIRQKGGLV
jgi:hypothetical protein